MSTEEASLFVGKCESIYKAVSVTTNFAFKTRNSFLAEIPHLDAEISTFELQDKQLVSYKLIVVGEIYVLLTKAFANCNTKDIKFWVMLYIPSQDNYVYCFFQLCEI